MYGPLNERARAVSYQACRYPVARLRASGIRPIPLHPVSVRRFPSFQTQPPGKSYAATYEKKVPEQPSPWRKSCKRESCYGDRVY